MLEKLKQEVYEANMLLPKYGLVLTESQDFSLLNQVVWIMIN